MMLITQVGETKVEFLFEEENEIDYESERPWMIGMTGTVVIIKRQI